MTIINDKILYKILVKTFSSDRIPEKIENIKMGDFKSWDSLGNFRLLLALEDFFEVRFSLDEIAQIKSVKQIKKHISEKLSGKN
jgi:acyl carrier protein